MTERYDYTTIAAARKPLLEASNAVWASALEPKLVALVDVRASQLNGCAFCLAMHARAMADLGDDGPRLWNVSTWRESPWYSERERAALEWTEALTLVANGGVSDAVYERVRTQFDEPELVMLTLAVTAINAWNRFSIAFRTSPEKAEAALRAVRSAHR